MGGVGVSVAVFGNGGQFLVGWWSQGSGTAELGGGSGH